MNTVAEDTDIAWRPGFTKFAMDRQAAATPYGCGHG